MIFSDKWRLFHDVIWRLRQPAWGSETALCLLLGSDLTQHLAQFTQYAIGFIGLLLGSWHPKHMGTPTRGFLLPAGL